MWTDVADHVVVETYPLAADFFTVQTLTFRTVYVFVALKHPRREIVHWNVTAHPTAAWVRQQIFEATPWGAAPRFLIHDRDRNYGGDFAMRARAIGIETVLTAVPRTSGERARGTGDRDDPPRVSRSSDRAQRGASPPSAPAVRHLLQ